MNIIGSFINPSPSKISDIPNDNNYLEIHEYPLNEETLTKGTSIVINDLKANDIIVKMTLNVKSAFMSELGSDTIEVVSDSGKVLFSKNINDMNVTGIYMTDCYYNVNGNENELVINHTLYSEINKFVAVTWGSKYFAYSTDGINWTEGTLPSSRNWRSVCYGNGKFVTVADSSNYFAYSTDGINWTEGTISSTNRYWRSVCYGNGKFVAVTYQFKYFAYSTDGINWTEGTISDTSRSWQFVCYGNGKFVAVADSSNYFAYSTDGINWTEGTISSTSRRWYSVCYGNGKYVAVAYNSNYFAYSYDGINWTEGTSSNTSGWYSVCISNFPTISYGDAILRLETFENTPKYEE